MIDIIGGGESMETVIISGIFTVVGAVIGGICSIFAYGRTAHATLSANAATNHVNTKNMLIAQNTNLLENRDKVSERLYQVQQDSIDSEQDKIVMYYELKGLINELEEHGLAVQPTTKKVVKNYAKKLDEDTRNSL